MENIFNSISGFSWETLRLVINGFWPGAIFALIAWGVVRLTGTLDPSTRYKIWGLTFIVIFTFPFFARTMPDGEPAGKTTPAVATVEPTPRTPASSPDSKAIALGRSAESSKPLVYSAKIEIDRSEVQDNSLNLTIFPSGIKADSNPRLTVSSFLLGLIPISVVSFWTLVSGWFMIKLGVCLWRLRILKKRSYALDKAKYGALYELIAHHGSGRRPALKVSEDITVPVSVGFFHPVILFPSNILPHLDPAELKTITLHELSHIRRRDDWGILAQKLAEAVFFFHPALILIGRRLDLERELACDDWVVSHTGRPREYALCLTRLADLTRNGAPALLATGALFGKKQIFERLETILKGTIQTNPALRKKTFAVLAVAVLTTLALMQVTPVIAFPGESLTYGDISGMVARGTDELAALWPDLSRKDTERAADHMAEKAMFGAVVILSTLPPSTPSTDIKELTSLAPAFATTPVPARNQIPIYLDAAASARTRVADFFPTERRFSARYIPAGAPTDSFPWAMRHNPTTFVVPPAILPADSPWVHLFDSAQIAYLYSLSDMKDQTLEEAEAIASAPLADITGGFLEDFFDGSTTILDGDKSTWTYNDGNHKIRIEFDGEVELTDDGLDIKSLSPKGYVEISEKKGGARREIQVDSDRDGNLHFVFFKQGDEAPFDDEAKRWMGDMLEMYARNSGIGAEARVNRIYQKDGLDAVLEDIRELDSDYILRLYYSAVLSMNLPTDELIRVLEAADLEMDSDYEKAELLIQHSKLFESEPQLLAAYVKSVESIDSDYETRRVLSAVSLESGADQKVMDLALNIAGNMDSDYEKAELLIDIARNNRGRYELSRGYMDALGALDSDYETARILKALIDMNEIDAAYVEDVVRLAETSLDSDYEKAELLIYTAGRLGVNSATFPTYVRALSAIDSDYEKKRTLMALGDFGQADEATLALVMGQIALMDSDYEKAEALLIFGDAALADDRVSEEFFRALGSISSDYEISRVMQAVLRETSPGENNLKQVLIICEGMGSDFEKANILRQIARHCRDNGVLEDAFVNCIESMDSQYEKDRLYAELYRKGRRM